MTKVIVLFLFFITVRVFGQVVIPSSDFVSAEYAAKLQVLENAEDELKKAENALEKAKTDKDRAEKAVVVAKTEATKEERFITEAEASKAKATLTKAKAEAEAVSVIWIENIQHYTGSIPATDAHIGSFTLPASGIITSFSARFHTNTKTKKHSAGGWLCGNHGGQGDGYLNNVHISYSREGYCGRYISDMGFVNSNLNIPIIAHKPIVFKFDGYAGAPWHSSSYDLYLKVKSENKAATAEVQQKAVKTIDEAMMTIKKADQIILNAKIAKEKALINKEQASMDIQQAETNKKNAQEALAMAEAVLDDYY